MGCSGETGYGAVIQSSTCSLYAVGEYVGVKTQHMILISEKAITANCVAKIAVNTVSFTTPDIEFTAYIQAGSEICGDKPWFE